MIDDAQRTCETSRWFSLSQVSRMLALRLNRAASCSSFSCLISSSRSASSRSCSAFSSRSHALLMSEIILPSFGVYGFWLFARIFDCSVNSKTSKFPFSTNLKRDITSKQT